MTNEFWESPAGLFVGAMAAWGIGLWGDMGFFYFAAVGLIWGVGWSSMHHKDDYDLFEDDK